MGIARNCPAFYWNTTTRDARNAEILNGSPFTDDYGDGTAHSYKGGNAAAHGIIGITTNIPDPPWEVVDQFGVSRNQMNSQYIGGNGLGAGDRSVSSIICMMPDYTYEGSWLQLAVADADAPNFGDTFDTLYDSLNAGSDAAGAMPIVIGDTAFGLDYVG